MEAQQSPDDMCTVDNNDAAETRARTENRDVRSQVATRASLDLGDEPLLSCRKAAYVCRM